MEYDIVFNYMFVCRLVHSIIFSFSTECSWFGHMSGCIVEEARVMLYFSKAAEPKRQQIAKGEGNREKKRHVGRTVDVCCPGEINSCAVPGTDFLCDAAHFAKPDFP